MKKFLSTILIATVLLGTIGAAFVPGKVQAQTPSDNNAPAPAPAKAPTSSIADKALTTVKVVAKVVSGNPVGAALDILPSTNWAASILAYISYFFLTVTSGWVTATAAFLSLSINITTHIKDIYDKITGINVVWTVVRDMSSMFIIFMLLYYSILTIIGKGGSKVSTLIINIFLAGVFINFSLFFVKVAVDASNLVSLQFYNAIAPKTETNNTILTVFNNGGLANVLLQSLKVQTIYKSASAKGGLDINTGIIFATIGGIIIMITTAFSFLAAATAFTIRTALLLFIMAVSPVFFAGLIFPEIKARVSDKILGLLKNQLIFMPVYLFFMYVALKILSDPGFNNIFNQTAPANSSFAYVWTGIIIQYTIAALFINLPLVAAISVGGWGMKWAPDLKGVSGWFGGKVGGAVGRNTLGRAGKKAGEAFDNMAAKAQENKYGRGASSVLRTLGISQGIRGGLESVEKSKYGGRQSLGDVKKEDKDRAKAVSAVSRANAQTATIKSYLAVNATAHLPADIEKFRKDVGEIDAKELQEMDFDKLKDPRLASSIPSSKFDTLIKELTPSQQKEIKTAREEGFKSILAVHGADFLINKAMKGKSQDIAKLPTDVLTNKNVAISLDPTTLRKIIDENVGQDIRDKIRSYIENENRRIVASGVQPTGNIKKAMEYFSSPAGPYF